MAATYPNCGKFLKTYKKYFFEKIVKKAIHHYYNNIVNVNRFNNFRKEYLGYQAINESLQWLRLELRYGKNPSYEVVSNNTTEIDNPQPSL